jgi:16S rRNA (guanine527-N7)-methyltransferase
LILESSLVEKLEAYFELLRRWNRKVSLTSLPIENAGDEAIDRLLIEPLLAAKYLPASTQSVLDIGSGGGSPAVPLKLAAPAVSMRMVESKTRKAAFLREVVRELGLSQVEVESARFEQLLTRPELHEGVDVVTLRAVRVERRTLLSLQAFLRPGALLFLFRTGTMTREADLASPPLIWQASHSLVPTMRSHLSIFQKVK